MNDTNLPLANDDPRSILHSRENIPLYKIFFSFISSTRKETRKIIKQFPNGSKLLDLGCGYGRICVPLSLHGYNVIGLDIVPVQIELARELAQSEESTASFVNASMTALPFSDNSFDGLFSMMGSFHYIFGEDNVKSAFTEAYRVVREEGTIMISVDNFTKPFLKNIYEKEKLPLTSYSRENLEELLTSAGFEDVGFSTQRQGWILKKQLYATAKKPSSS